MRLENFTNLENKIFIIELLELLISDSLAMVSPQMMKLMIGFVETNARAGNFTNPDTGEVMIIEGEEQWKGYLYAFTILAVTMFQTVLLSQYFERMFLIGMNLRTSLISAIYRKALKMTGKEIST